MSNLTVAARNIRKDFNRRTVFRDLHFAVAGEGMSLAITGRNGSGKSTLVKILAGVLTPSKGDVEYRLDGIRIGPDDLRHVLGLVSPYLQLYDEFTAQENIDLLCAMRGSGRADPANIDRLFEAMSLRQRRNDLVRTYSSGMKQRLKYIFALVHKPLLLILDEPSSNLDAEGISAVRTLVDEQKERGILVVATNDVLEAGWCVERLHLG